MKYEKYIKIIFIILMFLLSFKWSCSQPFNSGPDEGMKMDICKYIVENNKLPHGGDEAVRNPIWGISYGFTPIFSYIISSIFMKVAMIFTTDEFAILVAARFVSVLCYTGTVIMVMKIAEKLFSGIYKWIFIVLITALPQLVFLGTYINNDSLAIFSTAIIIYSWIIGLKTKWSIKSCITMAIGLGLCALSYYNAYGFILTSIIIYIVSNFIESGKKINIKEFIKKGLIIFIVAFLIAGWWFIRSAIIYEGDFLGLTTTDEYAEKYAMEEYKPSKRLTPQHQDVSLIYMLINMSWMTTTYKSFIGIFGNMNILIPVKYYYIATIVFLIGGIGCIIKLKDIFKTKKDKQFKQKILFNASMILCIIIPILLSVYYSYCSDFQPQGRYIMPMLIPFIYFITIGIQNLAENILKSGKIKCTVKYTGLVLLCIGWLLIVIVNFKNLILIYYNL